MRKPWGLVVIAALLLTGCVPVSSPTPLASKIDSLEIVTDPDQIVGEWYYTGSLTFDRQPQVHYAADGTINYYDGCNLGGGDWSMSTSGVISLDVMSNAMGCPEDIDLRATVIAALDGEDLVLFDGDGIEIGWFAIRTPVLDESTLAGAWQLSDETRFRTVPTVRFGHDGSYSNYDGCNSGGAGTWDMTPSGQISTTGRVTAAACSDFIRFREISTAAMEGQRLVLFDRSGSEIGHFIPVTSSADPPDTEPAQSLVTVPSHLPARELVGAWTAQPSGSDDEPLTLLITEQEISVKPPCGNVDFPWGAGTESILIGSPNPVAMTCLPEGGTATFESFAEDFAWLIATVTFSPEGEGWRLFDEFGSATASLSPFDIAGTEWDEPWIVRDLVLDDEQFAYPGPLANGLVAATVEELQGTWIPEGTDDPGVTFHSDRWQNNGCHEGGAPFRVEEGGYLITHGIWMNAMACTPFDTILDSSFVGFDGDTLVMGGRRFISTEDM